MKLDMTRKQQLTMWLALTLFFYQQDKHPGWLDEFGALELCTLDDMKDIADKLAGGLKGHGLAKTN